MLRALTLVDILAQLQQDSGEQIAYNPTEVINALTTDAETLILGGEAWSSAMSISYPINVIQDAGPIGYWRLDDPAGATSIYDSSPWNTTVYPKVPGAVVGGVTLQAPGAMSGSSGATCNGTTGYIEVTSTTSLQRVGDMSVEVWFTAASLAAAQVLVSKGPVGEYHLVLNTNGSITLQQGPSFSQVVIPAASVVVGPWYHLVVARRAIDKTINAYLNGVSRFSGTYTTQPSFTANAVRLGAASGGAASGFFNGTLDEVAVYARPLSATQVSNHYSWAIRTPLNSNFDFEGGTTVPWVADAGTGASIATSTTWARSGTASMRMTPLGTGGCYAESEHMPVVAGQQYQVSGWVFSPTVWAPGSTVGVAWYNASNGWISTTTPFTLTLAAGVAVGRSDLVTAVPGAAFATIEARVGGSPPITQLTYFDLMMFRKPPPSGYGTARYGGANYPLPGPPAGAVYGDSSTKYGQATYA